MGDIVTKDQPLVEVQADKAALEVPSPAAGKITQILIKQGDQVKIGQLIFVIDPAGAGAAVASSSPPPVPQKTPVAAPTPAPAAVPVATANSAKAAPIVLAHDDNKVCLLYTSPSPRDRQKSRMPSSA